MYYTVAFSGSRNGGPQSQIETLYKVLRTDSYFLAHHGMCRGFDCIFANMMRNLFPKCHIVGHPCTLVNEQVTDISKCPIDSKTEVLPPLKRNKVMVDSSNILIACPPCKENPGKGGTWWTIEYAKKNNKDHIIIYPEGNWVIYLKTFQKYIEG